MNDSRSIESWRIESVWPTPPKMHLLVGHQARQAHGVDRLVHVAAGLGHHSAVCAAVPDGASSFWSWCSSTISHSGMCARGQLARPPSSAPPRSRSWGRRTGWRCPRPRARRSRRRWCPPRSARPPRGTRGRCASAVSGWREVDDHVGVAQHVGERDAQLRVGAAGQLHVLRALHGAAHGVAHAPGGARDARRGSRSRPAPGSPASSARAEGVLAGAHARPRTCAPGRTARAASAAGPRASRRRRGRAPRRGSAAARRSAASCPAGSSARSVDSMASVVRPFTFSRARSSSASVTPSAASRRSSSPITLHRLVHVVRPRAHVEADLAGVDVLAGERVDGVGQAALLAHLLEQPRRAGAAEDRVQHPQREAALVAAGSPGAPRHRWYCSVSLAWKRSRGSAGAGARLPSPARPRPRGRPARPRTSSTRRSWSMLPAAATTRFDGT